MATTPIRALVVTVSDSRRKFDDESGAILERKLTDAGCTVRRHAPVRDDVLLIRELVRSASTLNEADIIVVTGGTGLAPRDVTPEAIEPLFEKRIDGFGEEFRRRSWSAATSSSPWRSTPEQSAGVGARAMLSRATAGVASGTIIVALPGSPEAAELGGSLVVEMLPHAVEVASGRGHHNRKAK
jgi:molybdenum cofactor biosynthesis protein B